MVGIPGSGKSTVAKKLEAQGFRRFSADDIREELYGNANIQGDYAKVFGTFFNRLETCLELEEVDIVIDNTNLRYKDRKELRLLANAYRKHTTETWFVDVPLKVCLKRNKQRERHVDEEVILKFFNRQEENRGSIMSEASKVIGIEGYVV